MIDVEPEVRVLERLTRVFDSEPTVVAYPDEDSRRIWQDHSLAALPLAGSARG